MPRPISPISAVPSLVTSRPLIAGTSAAIGLRKIASSMMIRIGSAISSPLSSASSATLVDRAHQRRLAGQLDSEAVSASVSREQRARPRASSRRRSGAATCAPAASAAPARAAPAGCVCRAAFHGLSTSTPSIRPSCADDLRAPRARRRLCGPTSSTASAIVLPNCVSRELRGARRVAAGDLQVRLVDLLARVGGRQQRDDEHDRPGAEDPCRSPRGEASEPPHADSASPCVTRWLIPGAGSALRSYAPTAVRDLRLQRSYMRKTGAARGASGAFAQAPSARPTTRRVSSGSITPSSHRRAVA